MCCDRDPSRLPSRALTASVLLVMAASAAAWPAPAPVAAAVAIHTGEGWAVRGETRAIRAVAAAVAALARDLAGDGAPAVLPVLTGATAAAPETIRQRIACSGSGRRAAPPLPARLLDLPPPRRAA